VVPRAHSPKLTHDSYLPPEVVAVLEKINETFFSDLELAGGVPLGVQLSERIKKSVTHALVVGGWSKENQIVQQKIIKFCLNFKLENMRKHFPRERHFFII
jgi:hypothetical protein